MSECYGSTYKIYQHLALIWNIALECFTIFNLLFLHNHLFFFFLAAFLVLFLVPVSRSLNPRECRPEAMSRCTDPLKVVTDNKDLGFATSREELDRMCP